MGVEASVTDIGALIDKAEQMGLKVSSMENGALRAGCTTYSRSCKAKP